MISTLTVVIEPDENAYHAFVPVLPGCHSYGDTLDEVLRHIQEAIGLYISVLMEDGQAVPQEPNPFFVTRVPVTV